MTITNASVGAKTSLPTRHDLPTRSRRARLRDRLLALDPGWARSKTGVVVVCITLAVIGVEWLFVGLTHALQIDTHGAVLPPTEAAKVGFANHAAIVGASLTGVSAGLLSLVALADPRPRQILITLSVVSVLLMGGITFGLGLDQHHRNIGEASVVVALVVGCYLRRFGAVGFAGGIALFMGLFTGLQSSAHEDLHDLGWIAAELGLGLATAMLVLAVVFRPRPARALAGVGRGYIARTHRALELAVHQFENPSTWRQSRVHRALVRLNEAALMLDAHLSKPGAVDEIASSRDLHHRLFQIELATTNVIRSSTDISESGPSDATRLSVSTTLRALSAGELDRARACAASVAEDRAAASRRFRRAVDDLLDALVAWDEVSDAIDLEDFAPVTLIGSTIVSAQASQTPAEPAFRGWDTIRLAPWTRSAIQMAVAATATLFVARAVSDQRYYWALIAVFVTFMGTNNFGEQAGKAIYRALGTSVGVVIGSVLGHAVGTGHWHRSLVVLLLGLLWAFTFIGVNYAVAVVGITVMASQLYVQLGEFSDSLLTMRLKETLIGTGIAFLTVAFVVPLRTRRVVAHGFAEYRRTLDDVTGYARSQVEGRSPEGEAALTHRARQLDLAFQTLDVTARPTRVKLYRTGRFDPAQVTAVAAQTHSDSRLLVADLRHSLSAEDEGERRLFTQLVHDDLKAIDAALLQVDGSADTPAPAESAVPAKSQPIM